MPWTAVETRSTFVAWATEPFAKGSRRAAVLQPEPRAGLVWVIYVLRSGHVEEERRSGGAFYDDAEDHPEGAIAWATWGAREIVRACHGVVS